MEFVTKFKVIKLVKYSTTKVLRYLRPGDIIEMRLEIKSHKGTQVKPAVTIITPVGTVVKSLSQTARAFEAFEIERVD